MKRREWMRAGVGASICILIVALLAAAAAGCSSANAADGPLKIGQSDNGKAYTVKVGDIIEVVLPGNPTTGFSWIVDLSDEAAALLEQVGEGEYAEGANDEALVGAGGMFTFKFKALAEGQATLRLVYERPWETVDPEQVFEVQVTVE